MTMSTQGRSRPIRTAAITNLGCRVNQAEMDAAARLLRDRGIRLVDPHGAADLHLVNTCTVTSIADQKSRQAVRRARRASPDAAILVTGCSVEVGRATFATVDPAARLLGNAEKSQLLVELAALADGRLHEGQLDRPLPTLSGADPADGGESAALPVDRAGGPGPDGGGSRTRAGSTAYRDDSASIDGIADDRAAAGRTIADRTRAFVKVQDGCSFYCTYCIIPRARAAERSLPPDAILAEVRRAIADGRREIVLTGINIGTYDGGWSERGRRGSHARSALTLAGLVGRILAETDVERLRLSSIEPQHVDDELLGAWVAGAPRTLPHLHIPLQSGDDGVLRRMGRRYDTSTYARIVERARTAIPGLALHADVIAGFPSEEQAAHARSLSFIGGLDPAGLHVFRYSARDGTPATRMTGQVDDRTKKERAAELLGMAAAARARFARRQLGRVLDVLFESRLPDGRWLGHASNFVLVAAPALDPRPLENVIGRVLVRSIEPTAPDRTDGVLVGAGIDRDRPGGSPLPVADPAVRPWAAAAGARSLAGRDERVAGGFDGV